MPNSLRRHLIRLAHEDENLRPHLLPLLKNADADAKWGADKIEKCVRELEDVVLTFTRRHGTLEGGDALADSSRDAAETVDLIRKLSEMPAKLRRIR